MIAIQNLPILNCAREILTDIYQLRANCSVPADELSASLQHFVTMAKKHLYTESMIEKAHFLLSIALDEAYVSCSQNKGKALNIFSKHYSQANGGEVFFDVLEHYINYYEEYKPLLELAFVILVTGFRGKYAVQEDGLKILLLKRQQLSNILYSEHTLQKKVKSCSKQRKSRVARAVFRKKYWLAAITTLMLVFFTSNKILSYQLELLKVSAIQQSTLTQNT